MRINGGAITELNQSPRRFESVDTLTVPSMGGVATTVPTAPPDNVRPSPLALFQVRQFSASFRSKGTSTVTSVASGSVSSSRLRTWSWWHRRWRPSLSTTAKDTGPVCFSIVPGNDLSPDSSARKQVPRLASTCREHEHRVCLLVELLILYSFSCQWSQPWPRSTSQQQGKLQW